MGSHPSRLLQQEDILEIQNETGFTPKQITRLYGRFCHLDKGNNYLLQREDLERIPELAINPVGPRIIDSFFANGRTQVNFRQFVQVVAVFQPAKGAGKLNSLENKLKYVFDLYDIDADGVISREELEQVLLMMVGRNVSSEQVQSILDRVLQSASGDSDGPVTFEDFRQLMRDASVDSKLSVCFISQ